MKDVRPNTLRSPTDEAVVERLAWAVDGRRIDPPATRLQDMYDPADPPPVIHSGLAPRIRRQERRKARELLLRQPEIRI